MWNQPWLKRFFSSHFPPIMSSTSKKPSRYETKTTSNLSESNPEHKRIMEQMEKLEGGHLGFGLRSGAFEKGLTASDSVYLDDYAASLKQREIEDKAREEEMIRTSLLNKASHAAKDKPVFALPSKTHSIVESMMPVVVAKKRRKSDQCTERNAHGNVDKSNCASESKRMKENGDDVIYSNDDKNETNNVNRASDDGIGKSAVFALAMYASDSD